MALFSNASTTFTNNLLVNAEDVSDVIANISPTDTPFLSALRKTKATNTMHEFITDALATAANNSQLEGDVFSADAQSTPVRLNNRTQISRKVAAVSATQQASNPYGMKNLLAYRLANAAKELKRDQEVALTQNSTANAGNSTTARQSRGLEGWIATNNDFGATGAAPVYTATPGTAATDGTQRAFTETQLKSVLQLIYTQGGNPELIMVGPGQKQTFSTFTGNSTRFKEAEDGKLSASIDLYRSDFNTLKVVPNRFQRARTAFILDMDYWSLAELRSASMVDLPSTFDGVGKAIVTEYCLEAKQEKSSGAVRDLL
jgi:hypothetical protein